MVLRMCLLRVGLYLYNIRHIFANQLILIENQPFLMRENGCGGIRSG